MEQVINFILQGLYNDEDNKIDLPILKIQIKAGLGVELNAKEEKELLDFLSVEDLCKKTQLPIGAITLELTSNGKAIINKYKSYFKYMEEEKKKERLIINKLQEIIFTQFRKVKARPGHIVPCRNFAFGVLPDLTPPENDKFADAVNDLINEGYITYEKDSPLECFRLTEKGYKRIYDKDYSENVMEGEIESAKAVLPTVVILTAIKEEYRAVRKHLTSIEEVDKEGIPYEKGIFSYEGKEIANVIIREGGATNTVASQETERALYFKPDCMFFVGIGGSRKPSDFKHGDVIFPDKIYYYEVGKAEKDGFNARPNAEKPTWDLVELAKQERNKDDWKKMILKKWEREVNADVGVIASGEQILEHYDSDLGKLITKHYNDAAVIEMEGFGFNSALERQSQENKIIIGVVRGISDVVERDDGSITKGTDRRPVEAKELACDTASAFAFWLIYKFYSKKKHIRIAEAVPLENANDKLREIEEKKLRFSVKPRLKLNGSMVKGYEGEIQLDLLNNGELAILKTFRVIEGDVVLQNEHLPYDLEKNKDRKVFFRTKNRSNSNYAKYTIEIEYEDALGYKYISVIKGEGGKAKITETNEL